MPRCFACASLYNNTGVVSSECAPHNSAAVGIACTQEPRRFHAGEGRAERGRRGGQGDERKREEHGESCEVMAVQTRTHAHTRTHTHIHTHKRVPSTPVIFCLQHKHVSMMQSLKHYEDLTDEELQTLPPWKQECIQRFRWALVACGRHCACYCCGCYCGCCCLEMLSLTPFLVPSLHRRKKSFLQTANGTDL